MTVRPLPFFHFCEVIVSGAEQGFAMQAIYKTEDPKKRHNIRLTKNGVIQC